MKKSYYPIGGIFFGLILTASSINVQAQTRTISGTVTSSNKPLSGVIISQKGSGQVTTTNEKGTYQLEVTAENPILLFRHPEYSEKQITVTNQSVLNINLEEKVKSIEEVVLNAGYYNVKAKESTGSISKVTAKDIENQPVNNVLSALQGRIAGVNISANTGNNGGSFDIQIRGRNSLRTVSNSLINGNEPLYIINGIPMGGALGTSYAGSIEPLRNINPLNGINPNDIENIEILKDADATAIYGSRGANGVILVTTKKGTVGEMNLTLNTNLSLSTVASRMKMMSTQQYVNMREQAYANDGISIYPSNTYDINGRWDKTRYTDWQKALTGSTAENSVTQVSLSGGNNRNSFIVSASHGDQSTVFPGNFHYKTNNINSAYTYSTSDKKLTVSFSNSFASISNNTMNSDFTRRSISLSPNAPALYDFEGNTNWENNTFTNPIASLNGKYSAKTLQLNQNFNGKYSFWNNWQLKINGGFNHSSMEEYSLSPNTMNNPNFPAGASPVYSTSGLSTSSSVTYIVEPQISWNKKLHNSKLEILAGTSYQQTLSKNSAIRGTGFASNALLHNISAASIINMENLSETQYKYAAIFGRVNWNYKDRYIMNITGRRDGSSRFGLNNRFADFGALGAAWIFSEESFLKKIKWLSYGKIRGSYGITGSDMIGDYQFMNTYTMTSSPYNSVAALTPARLYNPNFTWEKTNKLETALEISFLKNRINLIAAWYKNKSSNQLVGVQLPLITGFSSVQANLDATVQNTGWEFELNTTLIKNNNWLWLSNFNISLPKNKLLAFPGLAGSPYANMYVVGESTTILKLLQFEGIDATTGQYKFTDFNGDGKISLLDDSFVVGDIGAKIFGGWQHELKYRKIGLSFLLQFVKQNQTNYYRDMATPGTLNNQPVAFLNVWSPENLQGVVMPYSTGTNQNTNLLTSFFKNSTAAVSDASFIRLKNIQLNYTIGGKGKFIKDAKLYLQGQNLITWTRYFGLDPEFLVSGYLPPLKTYSFGFQITF